MVARHRPRQRTGVGLLVSTSLLRAGMYQMGTDLNTSLRTGLPTVAASVRSTPNPLLTGYRCANEEWIWLLGLEGDRHWPNIAAALELDHLRDDPRFATMEGRRDHATEVTATLQDRFGSDSRAAWGERLDAAGVWWAKVQHAHELIDDEQAHAAGGFVDVPVSDGTVARMVASLTATSTKPPAAWACSSSISSWACCTFAHHTPAASRRRPHSARDADPNRSCRVAVTSVVWSRRPSIVAKRGSSRR